MSECYIGGEKPVVCIDMGSLNIRAGLSLDDSPQITTRSLVGYPKHKPALFLSNMKSSYVGDEAFSKRGILQYSPMVRYGEVSNFDNMEIMWLHLFENELRLPLKDSWIVSADAVFSYRAMRERTAMLLFETFEVEQWYAGLAPVMAFYGITSPTGLSVCIGDGVTQLIPIVEGRVILERAKKINFGGETITKYLMKLSTSRGYYFDDSSTQQDIIRDVKEKFSYVLQDEWKERVHVSKYGMKAREYTLPDGNVLCFGKELFECNEAWFNPALVQTEYPGIHQLIVDCVESLEIDNKRVMYENIVLSGAATFTEGFCQRLQFEIQQLIPESVKCRVVAGSKRDNNVWLGCSVLGSMTNYFHGLSLKREEYDEDGPYRVHSKFMEA